jgi:hypothetical protein
MEIATPHNIVCDALWKFCVINSLRKLEIHKVLLRFRAFFCRETFSQIAFAELCGLAKETEEALDFNR